MRELCMFSGINPMQVSLMPVFKKKTFELYELKCLVLMLLSFFLNSFIKFLTEVNGYLMRE